MYSVEFRAALRGKFGNCGPKRESRHLRADIAQATLLTPRQPRLQPLTASPARTVFQFGRANETIVSFAR
jgi:hypothetical protein